MVFQWQAFDSQGIGDSFLEPRLEMIKKVVQDYREAFKRSIVPRIDLAFFLCCQMCDFLHRLLKKVVPRNCFPDECDWVALRSFDFGVG